MSLRRFLSLVAVLGMLVGVGLSVSGTTPTQAALPLHIPSGVRQAPIAQAVPTSVPSIVLQAPAGPQPVTGVVDVQIQITGATNLGAFEFDIEYNQSVAHITSVSLGTFLGASSSCNPGAARCATALGPLDTPNTTSVGAYSYGAGPGATGDGLLGVLHLQPAGVSGTVVLHLTNARVADVDASLATPSTQDATIVFVAPTPTATNTPVATNTPLPTNTPTATSTPLPGGLVTHNLGTGLTAADLATSLVGEGVSISNITYSGSTIAAGGFSGGTGIIGFEQGVILSSGNIANVIGPNISDGITANNGLPGDANLTTLASQQTYDASVLEFDFVPNADHVFFQYVFASDEYNEYVGQFNDVFAFFVNGTNCATVNGTTAVSINTINKGSNPTFYRNNDLTDGPAQINTEMDGLTVVLECSAAVNQNATNHIKLAIADAGDFVLDSNVFLKGGSFSTTPPGTPTATPTQVPPTGTPTATPTQVPPTSTPTATPVACELYPIAIHKQSLVGVNPGDTISNILNGVQPGNFGWLTWTGEPSDSVLATSLTPPGNSAAYVNPYEPNDHLISVGDYVQGRPGVNNSAAVRTALNKLESRDIVVSVWDKARGTGNNSYYGVTAFARLRLLDYSLAGNDRFISARFLGYATCGN